MNAIATLDEAVDLLGKEIAPEFAFTVSCEVWRHRGWDSKARTPNPRVWSVWINLDAHKMFEGPDLTQCVSDALAWYREHRKAVTA